MPYDVPDPDKACVTCDAIPPESGACEGCKCADPAAMAEAIRRGYNTEDNWEDGYHWKPCMWTCDMCGLRYLAGIHFPAINAGGVTICKHPSCFGAILQGLEAMRKAGLALHAGLMYAYQLEAGQQSANEFYRQLARAGEATDDTHNHQD